MEQAGFDALLIVGRGDHIVRGRISYLANFHMVERKMLILLPAKGDPILVADPLSIFTGSEWIADIRQVEYPGVEIGQALVDLGLAQGRIGVVGMDDELSLGELRQITEAAQGVRMEEALGLFEQVRTIKSPLEIVELEHLSALLRRATLIVQSNLTPGITERELLSKAGEFLWREGCMEVILTISRPPFGGHDFPTGFRYPTLERISAEDTVVVSFDVCSEFGYWCELRRVYSFKPPSERERRFWEFRVETIGECLEAMKPGAAAADIQLAIDRVFGKYGYDQAGVVSPSAHGIGIEIHEPPVVPGWEVELREHNVVCLHPFARLDADEAAAVGDISVADSVLVTASGARRLTDQVDQWIVVE
jgi:Xaa-Pro aminopeptidase